MNHYTTVTAEGSIEGVSVADFEELKEAIEHTGLNAELGVVYTGTLRKQKEVPTLYIFGEENFDVDLFNERGAPEIIGKILKKAKLPHFEFGVAFHGSKAAPESAGGTAFRIYADGHMSWQEHIWPKYTPKKPKAKKK